MIQGARYLSDQLEVSLIITDFFSYDFAMYFNLLAPLATSEDGEVIRETPPGFWDEAAWYYEPDLTPSPVASLLVDFEHEEEEEEEAEAAIAASLDFNVLPVDEGFD